MSAILLAPHLEYPPRHGADIYAERLGCYLSIQRGEVLILGASTLTYYENGSMLRQETYPNAMRSKNEAVLRALMKGGNYLAEKFLTPGFRLKAAEILAAHPNSLIVCSYILTASLLTKGAGPNPIVVLSHNDDVAWFRHLHQSSKNPLQKLAAWFSERWVERFLHEHAGQFVFAHISAADYAGYQHILPDQRAIIVPAGVDIEPLPTTLAWDGITRLFFFGSLSANLNYAALAFFRERFWPVIQPGLAGSVEVWVAGSRPSPAVQHLCRKQNWPLYPDLSDEDLRMLFSKANFSILPFPYTTGAKLKLLQSLAAGLPVLGTTNMVCLPGQDFPPNLYSDDPQDWLAHLRQFAQAGLQPAARQACQQFAAHYQWKSIAAKMDEELRQMGI